MGFKEAFTRGQEGKENLIFDDQAFYFFSISILSIILIPLTFSIINPLIKYLFKSENKAFRRIPKSAHDQTVLKQVQQEYSKKWLNKGYYLKVLICIVLVFLLMKSYQNLPNENAIKGFDPYEILEIDATANDQQIRKAFKKLSIKYHPDKNPDDPQAASKFIMLTKAYECLTDDAMKENCRKFGNPDGAQAFHVGIALPSFLLDKQNRAAFLAIIFLVLLVIVPVLVLNALNSMGKYDDNGILYTNYDLFLKHLNENFIVRNCPKLISQANELANLQITSLRANQSLTKLIKDLIEEAEIRKITNFELNEIFEQKKKKKDNKKQFNVSISFILVYAHLFRKDIDHSIKSNHSLVHSCDIIYTYNLKKSAILYSLRFSNKFSVEQLRSHGYQVKFMGLRCINTLLDFSQLVVQGLWEKEPDVFQVLFFKNEATKYMKREKYPELKDLIKLDRYQRVLPNWIPSEKREEVHDELDLFPRIIVKHQLKCEDETVTELTTDDLLNLVITITRENTPENQDVPFAHSNAFTHVKEECWHIMIAIDENIYFHQRIGGNKRQQTANWRFFPKQLLGNQTELNLVLVIKSDCYRGLDLEIPLSYKFKNIKDVNREIIYHEEDKQLDQEISLFNRMINPLAQSNDQNESDDDSSSDEDSKKQKKSKSE